MADADTTDVPIFEVDATWPEPLEYPQILGAVTGVAVDSRDHVFVVTRQDRFTLNTEIGATLEVPGGECCVPSSPVLEFDPAGNLVRQWGGPSSQYTWFNRPHGIAVDPQGNVWLGGSGTPAAAGGGGRGGGGGGGGGQPAQHDTHILKFSGDGTFITQIGQAGAAAPNSQSTTSFGGVARIAFDADENEVYVADGYVNRRVVVLDMATGAVKRSWGAYGNPPDDADLGAYDPAAAPAQQFRTVTCALPSNDGLVYVCDRGNNRIQVFETDGTFVTETIIAPNTRGEVAAGLSRDRGSVWDVAFSPDSDQRYLYVADGMNERVYILDRETLEMRTSFGTGGRYPSHFLAVGSLAVDSQGNVYTGEDEEGKRVQKFVNLGLGAVTAEHQGPVWPNR
jgi:DNA-binding beta-propeller fold protein YncE